MNKLEIGKALKLELTKGYDVVRISRWAFRIYSENIRSLDSDLRTVLENLFAMEDDPQFELTEKELHNLADNLIIEGEQNELFKPILEIKETAENLGDNSLLCPICQEIWISHYNYGMVRCPKCGNKLLNPKLKS